MTMKMNRDPEWLRKMAEQEAQAGSVTVPFMSNSNFFMCGQEGLYALGKGHEHKSQKDAEECTLRWGVGLALRQEKLIPAVQAAMKFIRSRAPKSFAHLKVYQELEAALGLNKPKAAKAGKESGK